MKRSRTSASSRVAARSRAAHDEGDAGRQSHSTEEPPPFGGSWRALYAAVLINLAALVALFYLFTRALG
jgi:hypothetical protein